VSKVLLREYYSLCEGGICKDLLTEEEKRYVAEGGMILSGIMQKADTQNGNGRVYPYKTLLREVENYKKLVKENRALGECVDSETQIMTEDGWKYIPDISDNEKIFTLNSATNEMELQEITRKVVLPFDGEMLHFTNDRSIDMMLTPTHNVLYYTRNGSPVKILADAVATMLENNSGDISHSSLKRGKANWVGNSISTYRLGQKEINAEDFMAFMGIYLSEGCVSSSVNKVQITQKKKEETAEIEELCNRLPFKFNKTVRSNGTTDFVTSDNELVSFLRPLGKSHEKYVPKEIKNLSPNLLTILLDWMLKGDGRNRKNRKGEVMRELYTTSKQMADDFSEIFYKLGAAATINEREQKDRVIEGRTVLAKNSRLLYIVSESTARDAYLSSRFVKVERVKHTGEVYCVSVPNKTWMMKRNGSVCWTSNCDHPEDSVINLKNASHLVTDIWMEGKDVMGKMKILDTPSGKILQELVRGGVQLGISSRGMGSVSESQGQTMVEEDFQLICFDMVSEPSTPGAFMMREAKEFKNEVFTSADRINRLLNEVLDE